MKTQARILIVDNNDDFRASIRDDLVTYGYQVEEADNPSHAQELIKMKIIDLAVIDMRLIDDNTEDRSGLLLIQEIPTKIPVIILTSHEGDAEAVRLAYENRIEPGDYLFKSDGVKALVSRIELKLSSTGKEISKNPSPLKSILQFLPFLLLSLAVVGSIVAIFTFDLRILLLSILFFAFFAISLVFNLQNKPW
jgi:DNA-binding response OmpR family regulator